MLGSSVVILMMDLFIVENQRDMMDDHKYIHVITALS